MKANPFLGVLIYIVIINIAAFIAFGADKRKAVHKKWRISEVALMGMICIGGIFGMPVFGHKIRKPMFRYGVPLILVLQIAAVVYTRKTGVLSF